MSDNRTFTPAEWEAIESAFAEAGALPSAERAEFLARLRRDDPALAAEVESLSTGAGPSWLDEPVVSIPRDSRPPPERIGPYRLVRLLGHGGMGHVWLAVREGADFSREVALKIVREGMESAEILAGFRAERQILGSLNHPNIAHLLDVGEMPDGQPYLVLEYVEGLPLSAYCDQHRLTVDQRLALFRIVCDAVQYAHQNLVVHRDLKPSNILVTAAGIPKLLDFGIAKVLSPSFPIAAALSASPEPRLLTPDYAAPEQVLGGAVTTASDVYSLGVLLFQLLAGRLPYRASRLSLAEVEKVVLEHGPIRPSAAVLAAPSGSELPTAEIAAGRRLDAAGLVERLEGDLDAIVLEAMAKEPERRYASVERLAADIDRSLGAFPIAARPRSVGYVAGRFVRRHRLGVALAAAFAVLLIAFVITVLRQAAALRQRSALVEQERTRATQVATFLQQLFLGADPSRTRGASVTARELLDRGAERIERDLGGEPAVQAELMDVVSAIYQNLGLYDPAERLAARALAIQRGLSKGDDPELAARLVEHAKALHYQGNYPPAEAEYREALAMWRRLPLADSTAIVQTVTFLGSVLHDQGQDTAAERLDREAIAIARRRAAPHDTSLATALNNLGVVLRRRGALAPAESAHREALAIRRQVLGEDHPDAIQSLNNVAVAVGSQGHLDAVEPLLQEVIERWRRVLGKRHPSVASGLTNLAGLYYRQHKFAAAIPLYREALEIRIESFGPRHVVVAQSHLNLGAALQESGDRAGARREYQQALSIRQEQLGDKSPEVQAARDALKGLDAKRH